jgi:hypothetical protein
MATIEPAEGLVAVRLGHACAMSDEIRDEEPADLSATDRDEKLVQRYEKVRADDVVNDAIDLFASDEDEPTATDIPDEGPPPPNA